MAKTLNTRIKNRFDSLSNWQAEGVELLQGEIAIVRVVEEQTDPDTGKVVNVPAFLMKVGENGSDGKPKAFSALPWLSAKAADVYGWAKNQYAKDIPVTFDEDGVTVTETLETYLTTVNTHSSDLAKLTNIIDTDTGSFVTGITYDAAEGKFKLSRSYVDTADIVDSAVTEGKLADSAVTTAKIASGAVTDAKLATDAVTTTKIKDGNVTNEKIYTVDASKVTWGIYDNPADGTLPKKIGEIDSHLSAIDSAIAGGVHFIGMTTVEPYTETVEGVTKTYVQLNGTKKEAIAGDIVIYSGIANIDADGNDTTAAEATPFEKEYISTGSAWQEIGDLSRVGKLEAWRKELDYAPSVGTKEVEDTRTSGAAVYNKFVTSVTQTDGKIAVTYARPSADNVAYGTGTVSSAVGAIESNYIKYNSTTKHAYVGTAGDEGDKAATDYIIFDCGSAGGWN